MASSNSTWQYVCEVCGERQASDSQHWRCPSCAGAFGITGIEPFARDCIDHDDTTLWRYKHLLPVQRDGVSSIGEGMTPLIASSLGGRQCWLKCDHLLPTGSFKDRGAAVLVTHLKRLGVRHVIVDSSGNAAAAMAGYCAANELRCTVFAPATTSPGKLVQARAFGATVNLVEGNREAVAEAAQRAAAADASTFYASHNWHPVFVEGVKTWALEVWEQLGERTPDVVFVPTGGGSAFVGGYRGFPETMPALIAAQPAACAPVYASWRTGEQSVTPVVPGITVAEGTRIGAPARGRQIQDAISNSGGWASAVSEREILDALRELWSQGVYVEPTAAVGAAAFKQSVSDGRIPADAEVVVLLTGNGLKSTDAISHLLNGHNIE